MIEKFCGISLKYISLVTLVVQNATLILSMRYSRSIPGPSYLISTAVFLAEVLKFIICVVVHCYYSNKEITTIADSTRFYSFALFLQDVFGRNSDVFKILLPAMLYSIQNNLQYVSISFLDVATYQVTAQLKILTTALFSVILLRRILSTRKWIALGILTTGVALVQLPSAPVVPSVTSSSSAQSDNYLTALPSQPSTYKLLGLGFLIMACVFSGISGVYFEKVLKQTTASLWLRNVQLAFFGIIFAFFQMLILDGHNISTAGFWVGYNIWTWIAILLNAGGGLIVALVVKHADNILKGFATSIAIIVGSVFSVYLFDFRISGTFVVGAMLVMLATCLYGLPQKETDDLKKPLLPIWEGKRAQSKLRTDSVVDIVKEEK